MNTEPHPYQGCALSRLSYIAKLGPGSRIELLLIAYQAIALPTELTRQIWCGVVASIHAPPVCKTGALPNELTPQNWCSRPDSNWHHPFTATRSGGEPDTGAKLEPLARLELAYPLTVFGLGNRADTAAKMVHPAGLEPAYKRLEVVGLIQFEPRVRGLLSSLLRNLCLYDQSLAARSRCGAVMAPAWQIAFRTSLTLRHC